MRAPYRFASPPELPRTDEADSYEAKLRLDRHRHLHWLVIGALMSSTVLTLATAGLSHTTAPRPPPVAPVDAVAHARTVVLEARGEVEYESYRLGGEETAALRGKREPAQPLVTCPVTLPTPSRMVRGPTPFDLLVVTDGARDRSPAIARVRRDVDTATEYLDGPYPTHALPWVRALETKPIKDRLASEPQVFFIPTKWQRGKRSSVDRYEPGEVEGTAYLYDFKEHRVVCAGAIKATNSPALEYTFNDGKDVPIAVHDEQSVRLDQMLDDDLRSQVASAIAAPNALAIVSDHH